jgi:DNA-binding response OmpR family regulator
LRRHEWMQQTPAGHHSPPAPDQSADSSGQEFGTFSFNGRTIDFGNLELRNDGATTHLTVMEAELLRYLIRHRGQVVSRKSILEEVWDLREDTDTRAIDNFVVRLRRYIEDDPERPQHLLTVRGVGYRFEAEPD